jgi:hypothetical protein
MYISLVDINPSTLYLRSDLRTRATGCASGPDKQEILILNRLCQERVSHLALSHSFVHHQQLEPLTHLSHLRIIPRGVLALPELQPPRSAASLSLTLNPLAQAPVPSFNP